jgi:hypothetical protein
LENLSSIDYSWGMGVLKGVLGWILGDDPGRVELEALPDEPVGAQSDVPIFLSASDLRLAVPAEYLRADAPFSSEDVKVKSSEFLDFSPSGPLRIPAFKLALWCPAFVSIPGGMKGEEIIEFPESVVLRSVALRDPAGGEVDVNVVAGDLTKASSFVPLNKGTPGTGDALSDEHGDPFADTDDVQVVLSKEELEETRRALRETILDMQSDGDRASFSEVLARESGQDSKEEKPAAPISQEVPVRKESLNQAPVRRGAAGDVAKPRPQMSNIHRIMRAYLQEGSDSSARDLAVKTEGRAVAAPETVPAAGSGTKSASPSADSVEQIVQAEAAMRQKNSELLLPIPEKVSQTFKRLERALSGYPTVTGVSARTPEGDFSSGDTSGYVSAGEAAEEIRRAFSLTGSMSVRGEAVTCLTVFNETDAVTVLCSRSAQIAIMHGTEGLPLSARKAASRWLADL